MASSGERMLPALADDFPPERSRVTKTSLLAVSWTTVVAVSLLSGCGVSTPQPESTTSFDAESFLAEQQLSERTALLEQYPDAIVPLPSDIDRIRLVDESEWAMTIAECLQSRGFTASSSNGGVSVGPLPPGQDSALAVAQYVCSVEYPVEPTAPLTVDEVGLLYDYFVAELVPCLERNGQSIPDAPSREVFVDQYDSPNSWWPYSFVIPRGPDDDRDLRSACPEYPAILGG